MARSIAQIKEQIRVFKNSDPNLNGTNYAQLKFVEDGGANASKVGIANLIAYVVAWAQNLQEQLWDVTFTLLQTAADKAPGGTAQWLQGRIFQFQYDDVIPQIAQVNADYSISFSTLDINKQIIAACAVTANGARRVTVKVAKISGTSLVQLTTLELSALQSYIDLLKPVGISVIATSPNPDYIYINATVVGNKAYAPDVLKNDIITAITNYLQTFSKTNFNGILYPSGVEDAMQAVPGVVSVTFYGFNGRPYGSTQLFTSNSNSYPSTAGYGIPETTVGYRLVDTIAVI